MDGMIRVENGDVLTALRNFLQRLMETNVVEALFVPLEGEGGVIYPALVTNPDYLKWANPLSPVMPINNARAISVLTGKHTPRRLAAVLRPCEIRALIELVKLQQANLEDVILIGIDCTGTCEVVEYKEALQKGNESGITPTALEHRYLVEFLSAAREGRDPVLPGLSLRPACRTCGQPIPLQADIHLHLVGVENNPEGNSSWFIPVTVEDILANKLNLKELLSSNSDQVEKAGGSQAMIDQLISGHQQVLERELAGITTAMATNGGITDLFATCIRCHNCMTACPICYCKTCLFRTPAMQHEPEAYFAAAQRKGAARMMSDTLLFHLTRLSHMSTSCVSCGMCTSACPMHIPVGMIFSAVGRTVQEFFDYRPGRDIHEPLPLITFQASEWTEIGEEK